MIASIFRASAASGPVRLFTPYKRRRRNQITIETTNDIQNKQKKTSEDENIIVHHDQGIVTKEENTWQSIADGIDTTGEYIDSTSQSKWCGVVLEDVCKILLYVLCI